MAADGSVDLAGKGVETGRAIRGVRTASRARRGLVLVALGVGVMGLLGYRWLALGWNAWHYATARPSARTQVVVGDGRAYVAAAGDGIEVIDLTAGRRVALLPPPLPPTASTIWRSPTAGFSPSMPRRRAT